MNANQRIKRKLNEQSRPFRIRYWHVLVAIFLAYLLFQSGTLYGAWVERRFGEPVERPETILGN